MEAAHGGALDAVSDLVLARVAIEDGSDRQAVLDALEAKLAELKDSTPELFRAPRTAPPPIDQGARHTVTSRGGSGDWLREQIGRS